MATTYKSTIEIKCWKQHTCKGCNSVFRYRMTRKCEGSASSPEAAKKNAQKQAEQALKTYELEPCPQCGLLQPEMVGQTRAGSHKTCGWLSAIALVIVFILALTHAINLNTAAIAAAAVCAVLGAWHLRVAGRDHNSNLEGNKQRAQSSVRSGKLVLDTAGSGGVGYALGGLAVQHKFALAFLAIGTLGVISPEIMRCGAGWPLNNECYPPVVGPGDATRLYFEDSITSIHGYWHGTSTVEVQNAAEAGLTPADVTGFRSTTNQSSWGSSISAKSSEKSNTHTVWADLNVPPSPSLAGKDLTIKVEVNAAFPQMIGSNNFTDVEKNFTHIGPLHLAAAGAGATYSSLYWYGGLIGAALFLFGSIRLTSLANGLKKEGNPTQVAPVE